MNDILSDLGLDGLISIKLPKGVIRFFKPSGEISKEKYFTRYLNPSDAMHLQLFLGYFASILEEDITVLAVGNSTFSKKYWRDMKKKREKNPKSGILPESYQDIDLLILPEQEIKRDVLEEKVKGALDNWELTHTTFKKTVSKKDFFEMADGTYHVLVDYNVGNKLISTKLPNNRALDLILGTEDILKSAKEKIKEEQRNKKPFSIIYRTS